MRLKKYKNQFTKWCCCILFLGLLQACEKPEIRLNQPNEDVRSLGGFIGNNFDYTLFAEALKYTGLMDSLTDSPGPFTVLAPNNTAFNLQGITHVSQFASMDRDSLRQVLAYHILPYRLMESDIPVDMIDLRYQTLSGEQLYASRAMSTIGSATATNPLLINSQLYFSGAYSYAQNRDFEFSNGVMHTLVKMMKPFGGQTVQQWLLSKPQYSILVAGLKKFNIWDSIEGEGPFTVFAVNNDIFEQWGITEESISEMDVNEYVGARLFGSYIMYNRHFFILDCNFFMWTQDQRWYVAPVQGDETYNHLFIARMEEPSSLTLDMYTLALSQLKVPYSYGFTSANGQKAYFNQENFLGSGRQVLRDYNAGRFPALNDNVCDNGVVHDLQAVLVMPDEARK
ncbi:fasciclin domain-containing protein [Sphingobacterium sp. LRF_L2]|uniref:fasciclin domain-containing protein n=1 Tax=Sphingobacterium sp. LRF_L2 TaxID=3369421 RepID=UPI003F627428